VCRVVSGLLAILSAGVLVGCGGSVIGAREEPAWGKWYVMDVSDPLRPRYAGPIMTVAYGNGRFVVADGFGRIFTAPEREGWRMALEGGPGIRDLTWGDRFLGVGRGGSVLTSQDGTVGTWTPGSTGTNVDLWGVAYANGQFVAVGENGTILVSPDGMAWGTRNSGRSEALRGVAYGNGQLVVVGGSGTILTSQDAATWTARNSGTTEDLYGVAYGAGQFVAVGGGYTILTSPDGVVWTKRASGGGAGLTFTSVAYGGGRFVAVGNVGAISSSQDGVVWRRERSGTLDFLTDVAYGGGRFIVGAWPFGDLPYVLFSR